MEDPAGCCTGKTGLTGPGDCVCECSETQRSQIGITKSENNPLHTADSLFFLFFEFEVCLLLVLLAE